MKGLTKEEIKKGYIWKCETCGDLSEYSESICENCLGEDA